ncbi:hypothetical protein B5X24_HaOG207729 [Helicoverpa armigera]|uniref:Uncharacterized protein n=1 Tax=Helicoverpa armigera TaxID=29058 RepID=A0A2W1BI11_HELAM|nr:hypothetical protein B5X24_HaOG207729 [Helicoverpa armigera]
MSYLSASENVGFSGIPQNISEASCATQYKMAVEGVSSGSCGEVNMFLHDNSGDEQPYIHLNDNFYSKFKIDPNELYTFHDSDVIAGEITVSHTEDNFIFSDNVDIKSKLLAESPSKELDLIGAFTNGDIKDDIKKEVVSNGHYPPVHSVAKPTANYKESKTTHTKVLKVKNQTQVKEPARSESFSEVRRLSVHSPKAQSTATAPSQCTKNSINSASTTSNAKSSSKQSGGMETFLDVFKREQGLVENASVLVKTEPSAVPAKVPMSPPKKASSGKTSQSKPRRGRGPAVHEALQRIPAVRKAIPLPNDAWHAPGDALFQCGPLGERPLAFRQIESSSSDDDNMPDFEAGCVSACVEESAAESRGARLALRRAALRRHVARAHDALALAAHHRNHRALASLLKKQLNRPGSSGSLPTQTPLLPLHDLTPLCAEHAWKRDNYDKLSRDCRPKKVVRKRACPAAPRAPRRAKRRRRVPARLRGAADTPPAEQSLSELNVCSNSSTYDSSEEAAMGALSETEYVTVASDSHEMEAVLDERVLDERVLDERALDSIADCVFHSPHAHYAKNKMQVSTSMPMEITSRVPS